MKTNEIIKIADKCMRIRISELQSQISFCERRVNDEHLSLVHGMQFEKTLKQATDELDKVIQARSLLFTLES